MTVSLQQHNHHQQQRQRWRRQQRCDAHESAAARQLCSPATQQGRVAAAAAPDASGKQGQVRTQAAPGCSQGVVHVAPAQSPPAAAGARAAAAARAEAGLATSCGRVGASRGASRGGEPVQEGRVTSGWDEHRPSSFETERCPTVSCAGRMCLCRAHESHAAKCAGTWVVCELGPVGQGSCRGQALGLSWVRSDIACAGRLEVVGVQGYM